jgi:hypothetical protein
LAIKEYLGIHNNADVVRYLVHRHARALQRREQAGERRSTDRSLVAPRGKDADEASAALAPEGAPGYLCLHCPLPECDEGDPNCPYQQATGELDRQRSRNRAAMRRRRARSQGAAPPTCSPQPTDSQ